MTIFVSYGIGCLGLLIIAIGLTGLGVSLTEAFQKTVDLPTEWQSPPPFLKIKKFGVQKQVVSATTKKFSCDINKSYMEVKIPGDLRCREIFSGITGYFYPQDVTKSLKFYGKSGELAYQNYELTIRDCHFHIFEINSLSYKPLETSTGAMKTMSFSLLKTPHSY